MIYNYLPSLKQPISISIPVEKSNDDLKISIQTLVKEFENNPQSTHAITSLSTRYGIKRRRLYDVVNVLTSIGCCQKTCLDNVSWLGKSHIMSEINRLRMLKQIDNQGKTLSELFPVDGCIGISNLTICFMLMFFAQQTNKIDLRFVGQFFSRNTGRYKTTLCKLYQICYILSALGITSRTQTVCEVVINPPYYQEDIASPPENQHEEPFLSITSLLSRPRDKSIPSFILNRRKEMHDCFVHSVAQKESA